ncbi:MAG TPA: UDP-N-acetylmuramate--L-alanine ligase [Chitinophagales bacterium]|nr:UDP-N-acetylmuramate--L-alanine ligase [Chitinophagales bacterium]
MKNLSELKKIYFLGIGGIGMSALARYFNAQGIAVSGYDKTQTALTDELVAEGIPVIFEDDLNQYPKDADLVIYTPAIPKDHKGLNFYRDNNYDLKKRSEVLGIISADRFTVAVAGSHGKTTVSSLVAHILASAGLPTTAFLGGICNNYNSNYIHTGPQTPKGGLNAMQEVVVIEADEFDRSFHRLQPNMAVITAVDTDHLDIYGTKENIDEAFIEFTNKIAEDGFLVIKTGQSIEDKLPVLDKAFYSLNDTTADVYCSKYWVVDGGYLFNVSYFGTEIKGLRINIGGFHNIENAIAALTIAKELKVPDDKIKAALASFKGIRRRFEKVFENDKVVFIDDYAHHPEEIRVFLESVREIYPKKKITAVFQPHLFSRTKDLAKEFAEQLSKIDEVVLLDIYPARELPVEGVTSSLIFDQLTCPEKTLITKSELVDFVKSHSFDVLVTIGAGDIDKYLAAIKEILAGR